MLCKYGAGTLHLRDPRTGWEASVDVSGFADIAAVRPDPEGRRLAIVGTPKGAPCPGALQNERGRQELLVVDLASGARARVWAKYAADPRWLPGGARIAFYSGAALASVAVDGTDFREHLKLGRFSWGPPAVSVSPGGRRLGATRWRGDSRHIATVDLATGEGRVFPTTCYHYAWLDDTRILYNLGAGIRVLHVDTGRTTGWLKDVPALLERVPAVRALVPELGERLETGGAPAWSRVERATRVGERIYFTAWAANEHASLACLLSLSLEGEEPQLHHGTELGSIVRYEVLEGGRTLWVDVEAVGADRTLSRVQAYAGEGARMDPTWLPLLTHESAPEFGFILPVPPAA